MVRVVRSGFTLIEMVVVIGIIILATGFIVPSLSKFFQHRQLNNAGTLITNALNEARNEAVTRRKPVRIVFLKRGLRIFNEGSKTWQGGVQPYDTSEVRNVTYHLEFADQKYDEIYESVVDEEAGPIDGEDVSLRFMPDGTVAFTGSSRDIATSRYNADPPDTADIVLNQGGEDSEGKAREDDIHKGFIDIRPTGRVTFKVVEKREKKR